MISHDLIERAPKVLLHDHLDGGLRPQTVAELADETGYDGLPTSDPHDLAQHFVDTARRGSLEEYLEGFAHTVGVTQTREALQRVAREAVEDLADDGVVYAEIRFAPELHTMGDLELDDVLEAVLDGVHAGQATRDITVAVICCAMRTAARSYEIAEVAVRWREQGVVGFDIAGAEAGFPPTQHLDAFQLALRECFHITVHAGESFGPRSIWEALQWCGAERLGHGLRIVDDITVTDDGDVELGRLAGYVRDRRIPLEMCPTSNVHTGGARSIAEHPIQLLRQLRYRVTVNTDNRLMSDITMSGEFTNLVEAFDLGLDDLQWLTVNAMKSAFWPFDDRLRLIEDVIKPRYAALREPATAGPRDAAR
ncbi:adenosine deaminase [Egibacter rhizosphaerae]|uniref:Adenosine deaminase n=1 Tax=Egibacter rhizosphaerae TaxID=1670831 RepID=A0A411YC51_9ACTN|nr:adenosine deaminase [Egibacter rhizosphaerae]QBI18727.1 adenosine deaminase [Egibacter rhizosphaerae]